MIKNILVSIDYELKEAFNNNYGKWDLFKNELNDILNYYKKGIYKSGKTILNKRINNKNKIIELSDTDNKYIDNFSFNDYINDLIINIIKFEKKLSKEDLYDKIIYYTIGECIKLFKLSQINCCKELNIKHFKIICDDQYSCNVCKTLSKFILDVDTFNSELIHPYCKITILPLIYNNQNFKTSIAEFINIPNIFISIIKNIIMKLNIQLKDFITFKTFEFTDKIDYIIINNDKILISNKIIDKINIEEIIVRELLKDKMLDNIDSNKWEKHYNTKKDSKIIGDNCIIYNNYFVNSQSESNYIEYFIQSYINYILHASVLKNSDIIAYNMIKNIIEKEFEKG